MVLRSDELANEAEMDRDQKFRSGINRTAATAVSLGAGTAGGALASKLMPFLSRYVPTDLAIKGISKVSPRVGDFLKKGQGMGLDVQEGLNFIKDKIGSSEKSATPPKQDKNVVEQYSPELHQFILGEIKNGRSPIEAGALASMERKGAPNFKSVISKITKDHNTSWSGILESVYGPQKGSSAISQTQDNPQPNQPQGRVGPGQQALMDILAKINQKLGQ